MVSSYTNHRIGRQKNRLIYSLAVVCCLASAGLVYSNSRIRTPAHRSSALSVDYSNYINANFILMMVPNQGGFGNDLGGVFQSPGSSGTFYPYRSIEIIESGADTRGALWGGAIWLGGVDSASADTLVAASFYGSDYVPGPMADSTFQPDRPEYRVYKLYRDSLESNPNQGYLDWPVDQGAPVDEQGKPATAGDQMLWTVFSDADPEQHDMFFYGPQTAETGVEIQQTVWASAQAGDIELPPPIGIAVTPPKSPRLKVEVEIVDNMALTNHDYAVIIDTLERGVPIWRLKDLTGDLIILDNRADFDASNVDVTDGFLVKVSDYHGFRSFEVVANGAGVIDPPESCGAPWRGYPVPTEVDPEGNPTDNQQVGDGKWLFAFDGSEPWREADYGPYSYFLYRGLLENYLGYQDVEMRFTGSYANPGVGGSYVWHDWGRGETFWVPFELWRIGINSPDDPSDDLRLIPMMYPKESDTVYWMSSWGPRDGSGECGLLDCEHEISPDHDDPYTSAVSWFVPADTTPGESGYQTFEAAMLTDTVAWTELESPLLYRTVLVNWNGDTTAAHNGGATTPTGYNQDLPEQGTVFRLCSEEPGPPDTVRFTSPGYSVDYSGPEGLSIYLKYELINKGPKTLTDFFVSLFFDSQLGLSNSGVLAGCDSTENRFFFYQNHWDNPAFDEHVPAFGGKFLEGLTVPSEGDTAMVDGVPLPGYKDLGMSAFVRYWFDADPVRPFDAYRGMNGLSILGQPWVFESDTLLFMHSGDPVTGLGDLDSDPVGQAMLATSGPINFRPGDTQQVVIKLAVGQGTDRLNSITVLRQILEYDSVVTDVDDVDATTLPHEFSLRQNYPNPFNPSTTIGYTLPARTEVEITIFNALGQRVTVIDEGIRSPGEHKVVWNGVDGAGRQVATGVYFYRIKAGDDISTRKMLLLK